MDPTKTIVIGGGGFAGTTLARALDDLVLAFGNRARLDLIPGLAENALPLKTIGDAMHIRNMVLRRVAQIELETDPAVRRRLGHFVVMHSDPRNRTCNALVAFLTMCVTIGTALIAEKMAVGHGVEQAVH